MWDLLLSGHFLGANHCCMLWLRMSLQVQAEKRIFTPHQLQSLLLYLNSHNNGGKKSCKHTLLNMPHSRVGCNHWFVLGFWGCLFWGFFAKNQESLLFNIFPYFRSIFFQTVLSQVKCI